MLYQSADLRSAIDTAKQIQGWAHDAAGTEPPPPLEGSTMPMALLQQRNAQMGPPPPAPVGPALPPLPQSQMPPAVPPIQPPPTAPPPAVS
jgi:hypothetical protein